MDNANPENRLEYFINTISFCVPVMRVSGRGTAKRCLAVVKKPHTDKPALTIRGQIPGWIMARLKKEYKDRLIVKDEKNEKEELTDIFETDRFDSIESQMTPGKNLKIYRENAGLSQAELGRKLSNVPRQNISLM